MDQNMNYNGIIFVFFATHGNIVVKYYGGSPPSLEEVHLVLVGERHLQICIKKNSTEKHDEYIME